MTDKVMDMDQKAMDAMRNAGHKVGDQVNKFTGQASGFLKHGQQTGQDALNRGQNAAKQGANQAQNKVEDAQQQGQNALNQGKKTAEDRVNKAKGAAGDAQQQREKRDIIGDITSQLD